MTIDHQLKEADSKTQLTSRERPEVMIRGGGGGGMCPAQRNNRQKRWRGARIGPPGSHPDHRLGESQRGDPLRRPGVVGRRNGTTTVR